jgi:hypothetical protein
MNYTKKKPTVDGHYWVKARGILSGNVKEFVVHVYRNCETVFWDGENCSIKNENFLEWSDRPILHPGQLPNISMDCPKCGPSRLPRCSDCGEILKTNFLR